MIFISKSWKRLTYGNKDIFTDADWHEGDIGNVGKRTEMDGINLCSYSPIESHVSKSSKQMSFFREHIIQLGEEDQMS